MLAEFVDRIAGLASDLAKANRKHEQVQLPGHRYLLIKPDGTTTEEDYPPPDLDDTADDLASFKTLLAQFGEQPLIFVRKPKTVCSSIKVSAVLEKRGRRDRVGLSIEPSAAIQTLVSLGNWSKQKAVCEAIRDNLWECAEPDLLSKLRSLDFTRRNDGTRTIDRGNESLGRNIETKVQSKHGDLPEYVEFQVPWFAGDDFFYTARIMTCLDTDANNEAIRFVPRGDTLTKSLEYALKHVVSAVEDAINADAQEGKEIPVVVGSGTLPDRTWSQP